MRRLVQIIAFTPDIDAMRAFYERGVGLHPVYAGPNWTSYQTAGVTLALHPTDGRHDRELELTFESANLEADVAQLRERGVDTFGPIQEQSFGATLQLRDPDGNLLALRQGGDLPSAAGPLIANVILNVRDLERATHFYREKMGLSTVFESPHWIEFDGGDTRLALHERRGGLNHPLHAAQRIAWCFEADDLDRWVDDIRAHGVQFATAPTDEDFGLFAEAVDPDGNIVVFRQEPALAEEETELAGAFEEEEVTHQVAIRKPVKKGSRAVSRVALRPEYHEDHRPARRPLSATTRAVSSTRGAGPDKTRLKPKKTADEKKARAKPAVGHKVKADLRAGRQRRGAAASAGKSKPVKRASASRGRPR